jgi:hypothetical protein
MFSLYIEICVGNFIPDVPKYFWVKYAFISETLKGDILMFRLSRFKLHDIITMSITEQFLQ